MELRISGHRHGGFGRRRTCAVFLVAAALNGVITFLLGTVTRSGLAYHPLNGLVLAAALAIVLMTILFRLVHRAERSTA